PAPKARRLGLWAGCCPRAASGHPAVAPPTRAMNSRRLMVPSKPRTTPYHILEIAVLCATAFWLTRLPLWVKLGPAAMSATVSGLPAGPTAMGVTFFENSPEGHGRRHYAYDAPPSQLDVRARRVSRGAIRHIAGFQSLRQMNQRAWLAGNMWRMNFGTAGCTKNPLQIR